MISSRWLALGVFIILLVCISLFDKGCNWKEKIKCHGMMFLEGIVGGFIIDCIGINAGYYHFPREPFLSWHYFAIVIPCWGVFGLLVNCLWKWLGKEKFLRGMVVTLFPLFTWYEGSNLLTCSWVYTAPMWSVYLGWIPLVWTFAGCNRRRRVVWKIEQWRGHVQKDNLEHQLIRGILTVTRVFLVVVMFPLLISVLIRLCVEFPVLIRRSIPIWGYAKYLLAME